MPWASGPSRCEIAPSALLDCERMSTCLLATPLFLVKTDERQHVPVLYLHSLSVHRNPVQLANMLAGVYVVTPYSTKIVTLYCRLLYPVQTAPSNPVLADWSVPQARSRYRGGRGWPSARNSCVTPARICFYAFRRIRHPCVTLSSLFAMCTQVSSSSER